jgi:hypothetical protein
VSITTKVVSSNPAHSEVYSIQHYGIKIVIDLRQVGGFLRVLRFPPPIKLTATIQLKLALNTNPSPILECPHKIGLVLQLLRFALFVLGEEWDLNFFFASL